MIVGAGNSSSVGTLVERITGFIVLAKMDNATTKGIVDSFSAVLNRKPAAMCKTMTYDQGREMYGHKILTERTGVQSTLPTRTALGSVDRMRTPMACCVSTCRKVRSVDLLPEGTRCHCPIAQYAPTSPPWI